MEETVFSLVVVTETTSLEFSEIGKRHTVTTDDLEYKICVSMILDEIWMNLKQE